MLCADYYYKYSGSCGDDMIASSADCAAAAAAWHAAVTDTPRRRAYYYHDDGHHAATTHGYFDAYDDGPSAQQWLHAHPPHTLPRTLPTGSGRQ